MKITYSERETEYEKDEYFFTGRCYIGFDYKETRYLINNEDVFRQSVDFMKNKSEIVPIFDEKEVIIAFKELKGDPVRIFKEPHVALKDHEVIEVFSNTNLIVTIIPRSNSISIVSKYYDSVKNDEKNPPKIVIKLKELI